MAYVIAKGVNKSQLFRVDVYFKNHHGVHGSGHHFWMTGEEIGGVEFAWRQYHDPDGVTEYRPQFLELVHYTVDGKEKSLSLVRFMDIESLTIPYLEEV